MKMKNTMSIIRKCIAVICGVMTVSSLSVTNIYAGVDGPTEVFYAGSLESGMDSMIGILFLNILICIVLVVIRKIQTQK